MGILKSPLGSSHVRLRRQEFSEAVKKASGCLPLGPDKTRDRHLGSGRLIAGQRSLTHRRVLGAICVYEAVILRKVAKSSPWRSVSEIAPDGCARGIVGPIRAGAHA
jgi:hypothetical protein